MKIFLLLINCLIFGVNSSDYILWYDKAAENGMKEALPIGNGRIGGLIYGHPGLLILLYRMNKRERDISINLIVMLKY